MKTERDKRLDERNKRVEKAFSKLASQHPQWRVDELYKETAKDFLPLSARTIQAIITGEYERAKERERERAKGDPNQLSLL